MLSRSCLRPTCCRRRAEQHLVSNGTFVAVIEQDNLYRQINTASLLRSAEHLQLRFHLPVRAEASAVNAAGQPVHYPINYAANQGTWMVWNPNTGTGGGGAHSNRGDRMASILDGGNTLAYSK